MRVAPLLWLAGCVTAGSLTAAPPPVGAGETGAPAADTGARARDTGDTDPDTGAADDDTGAAASTCDGPGAPVALEATCTASTWRFAVELDGAVTITWLARDGAQTIGAGQVTAAGCCLELAATAPCTHPVGVVVYAEGCMQSGAAWTGCPSAPPTPPSCP